MSAALLAFLDRTKWKEEEQPRLTLADSEPNFKLEVRTPVFRPRVAPHLCNSLRPARASHDHGVRGRFIRRLHEGRESPRAVALPQNEEPERSNCGSTLTAHAQHYARGNIASTPRPNFAGLLITSTHRTTQTTTHRASASRRRPPARASASSTSRCCSRSRRRFSRSRGPSSTGSPSKESTAISS